MYYLMLAREYFIYHKQCHKHHKYMLYVLCAATAQSPFVYMVVDYAIVLCQGALWHIYSRSDASKIRSFLRKVSQPVQYSHTTSTI